MELKHISLILKMVFPFIIIVDNTHVFLQKFYNTTKKIIL
jgi:hypothetical protein